MIIYGLQRLKGKIQSLKELGGYVLDVEELYLNPFFFSGERPHVKTTKWRYSSVRCKVEKEPNKKACWRCLRSGAGKVWPSGGPPPEFGRA